MKKNNAVKTYTSSLHFAIVLASFSMILLYVMTHSPPRLIFDESLHLEGARILAKGFTLKQMLMSPLPSAAGPLYPYIHWIINHFTKLEAPTVRIVNIILFFLSTGALTYCMHRLKMETPFLRSSMMIALPMFWICIGMALTEIPAFTMSTLGVTTLIWILTSEKYKNEAFILYFSFIAAGAFIGFSILGRQTYLPTVVIFPIIAGLNTHWRYPSLLALLISCSIPLPVFILWGGLTPPSQAFTGEKGISIAHGLLAYAYLAINFMILAPSFFYTRWRWVLSVSILAMLINLSVIHFEWPAAAGLAKSLPPYLATHWPSLCGTLLITISAGFFTSILFNIWEKRKHYIFIFSIVTAVLLVGTSFGITHLFSSRYGMVGFPFALIAAQPFFTPSIWATLRLIAGCTIGITTLWSYYTTN